MNTAERILAVGVAAPYNPTRDIQAYFDEFDHLLRSSGVAPTVFHTVTLRTIEPGTFFTTGKLNDIRELCEKNGIERVFVSEPLSPTQERNLGDILNLPLVDRTRLILNIFAQSAHSAEGKLQVAIAQYAFEKSRLAGKGRALSQQRGGTNMRGGPGETVKEKEKRIIEAGMLKLTRELEHLEKVRATQRKQRLTRKVPHVCLVGYTNAGKSTILNQLTHAEVYAADQLFATLDTTTRALVLEKKQVGVISDTVGFIQMLPPQLINAFKSTLAELQYADLLLHVVDSADPDWEHHIQVVNNIFQELELSEKPVLYIFNKIDKIPRVTQELAGKFARYQPHVLATATKPQGLDELSAYLTGWFMK